MQEDDCCAWCEAELTPADRLRFETAIQAWEEGDLTEVVSDDVYATEPRPTCSRCRGSMETNRDDIDRMIRESEKPKPVANFFGNAFAIVVFGFLGLAFCLVVWMFLRDLVRGLLDLLS